MLYLRLKLIVGTTQKTPSKSRRAAAAADAELMLPPVFAHKALEIMEINWNSRHAACSFGQTNKLPSLCRCGDVGQSTRAAQFAPFYPRPSSPFAPCCHSLAAQMRRFELPNFRRCGLTAVCVFMCVCVSGTERASCEFVCISLLQTAL